ncbi:hypothetical protein QJS10_CPB20g01958 [Acorus calamus]|uniref:Secreted protein n=1 Tax=Acorus calamus TaxID=4465 RepID=A0AAV9C9X4_ACOCL|nr:hypothetical protein QJS10_CPB20g01958 [Acorus calamus]
MALLTKLHQACSHLFLLVFFPPLPLFYSEFVITKSNNKYLLSIQKIHCLSKSSSAAGAAPSSCGLTLPDLPLLSILRSELSLENVPPATAAVFKPCPSSARLCSTGRASARQTGHVECVCNHMSMQST